MKKLIVTAAIALMTIFNVQAQKIEVVGADGHGIPLVSVLTEAGNLIGTTDLNGVLADVKGAAKVAVSHVAYKPQLVSVASLQNGRIKMEDIDYGLGEIVVKPKPYVYVEVFYRVYVYRNDSLCYFLSGILPNAYDILKKKMLVGSYYHAVAEHCNKMGADFTWSVRAQMNGAGTASDKDLAYMEEKMKEVYFVTTVVDDSTHTTYSNPEGVIGHLVRAGDQMRMTLDAGKSQMYANKVKGEKWILEKRQKKAYDYQFTIILNDRSSKNQETGHAVEDYLMESNHWEYNDKKGHVKFFIDNYATNRYYMDKQEWKDKKNSLKEEYSSKMTLDQLDSYATSHNIPALLPATRQAIEKLKQW